MWRVAPPETLTPAIVAARDREVAQGHITGCDVYENVATNTQIGNLRRRLARHQDVRACDRSDGQGTTG